ncbi:MAG: hypothetical protein KC431_04605 [Myxococcales bacterium]|nr:hypothetical protein [Myxococcales bacterium]
MIALGLSLILAFAPAPAVTEAPSPTPEQDGYDAEQAAIDVETILVDRGKAYLEARARLEDHPALAAAAVVARLDAVPAPGPDQRNRLLNVLAALKQPEHVAMFGEQLRTAILQKRPTELWLQLLRKQGDAARPVLVELIGDRELSNGDRGDLLEVLVEVTAREALGELMVMVGRGSDELQDRLRRAVIKRARASSEDSLALAAGIDGDLDRASADDEGRIAQLLILRAACCSADESFTSRLERLAGDGSSAFQVRVAAIDGLGRLDAGRDVLEQLARGQSGEALQGSQMAEVLLSLALEALPEEAAAPLASELKLTGAAAPRLAVLGYRFATLPTGEDWLSPSQAHAWPEVRKAALERVADQRPGCDKTLVRQLATVGGAVSSGGDGDTRVGRAAVAALGRCEDAGGYKLLRELVEDGAVELTQRAEAARQLVLHDPSGPDYVAELLLAGAFSDLARPFAEALGESPEPTDTVREALCRVAAGNPMVASTAHDSFLTLFPGEQCE